MTQNNTNTEIQQEAESSGPYECSDEEQFFKLAAQFGLDELLPEWEISVVECGDTDTWEHYHPRAATEKKAVELAYKEAKDDSTFTDPMVYEVLYGPYADGMRADLIGEVLQR